MPKVTAFIDNFREAFGPEAVNEMVQRGRKAPDFWDWQFHARENGHEIGTKGDA